MAIDDEELARGLGAIAAPVRDQAGDVVGAVALAAPSAEIPPGELFEAVGAHLLSAAEGCPRGWATDAAPSASARDCGARARARGVRSCRA